jgi:hypothetical protein
MEDDGEKPVADGVIVQISVETVDLMREMFKLMLNMFNVDGKTVDSVLIMVQLML